LTGERFTTHSSINPRDRVVPALSETEQTKTTQDLWKARGELLFPTDARDPARIFPSAPALTPTVDIFCLNARNL
jgi:hypothetical protein